MAQSNFEERIDTYEIESTNVMTGDRDRIRYLYYQLKMSMAKAKQIDIIVSFLMESGVRMLLNDMKRALDRGVRIRILTGNYLGITQPSALYLIKSELGDRVDLRLYNETSRSFHPKSYIFHYGSSNEIYIGSSNISKSALTSGIEWNYRFSDTLDKKNYELFYATFEDLFLNHSIIINDEELKRYSKAWKKPAVSRDLAKYDATEDGEDRNTENVRMLYRPRGAQIEALYALQESRMEGAAKGLVYAATGIGKTYLAAFDSAKYERVLFVAHREEILKQAAVSFKNVRNSEDYGFFAASDIGELWKEYGSKLFASNIRNLLTKSDVNTAMLQTLETTSRLFWYYNNGITIICDNIEKQKIGGRDRSTGIFPIKNLSIVNGAQTTGTIGAYYEALSDDEVEQIFADAYVQVKVIQTKNADGKEFEKDFAKSITINNNMQNKIIARDFASQTDLQKRYKIELEQEGIVYHISRGDDEISTPTHFSISEAGRARCNTIGIKYMMIAHRGTNTYLFKNINSNEYKAVFNDTLSGIEIWNTVLIQRAIDEVLLKERKRNPDIREILIYGKDYLSYLIFNKMWRKISKTDIIEIKDHNKEEIRTYALSIAQKLSPYVKNIDKTTRNIFQNGSDIEKIHAQIKNII